MSTMRSAHSNMAATGTDAFPFTASTSYPRNFRPASSIPARLLGWVGSRRMMASHTLFWMNRRFCWVHVATSLLWYCNAQNTAAMIFATVWGGEWYLRRKWA